MSGQVDGFCTTCKRDVTVDESLKCPTCDRYVDPLSLPSVPNPERAIEPIPTKAPPVSAQSVTLPDIREARAWGKSMDDLLAALEREESEAVTAFEAARTRAQNTRRAAAAMRQIRSLVAVGEPTATGARVRVVSKPAALSAPSPDGRWSRDHDACRECGRTEVKHAAKGLCFTCYGKASKRSVS